MQLKSLENSPLAYAKSAGLMYLLIAVFGGFSIGYVPTVIVESGDAVATAENLLANKNLFRAGLFADLVVLVTEIVLTVFLFHLFNPVNKTISMIAAVSRIAMVMVMSINVVVNFMPLVLLGGADYLGAIPLQTLQAISLLLFEAHQMGVYVWGLFFGVHMLCLGYLVTKSGFLPRILGQLMLVGAFGYAIEAVQKLTATESTALSAIVIGLLVIVTIAEISFAIWLLIKGLDVSKWRRSVGNAVKV